MRHILRATTAIGLALTSVPAFAQGAAADEEGISDIVVTAQRKEESLQKAAIAIDAVGGGDLVSKLREMSADGSADSTGSAGDQGDACRHDSCSLR